MKQSQHDFNRDLNNYVQINNEIYRRDYENPSVLNMTSVSKSIFKNKFGFTELDWVSLPDFDGWTVEPSHVDYRQSVNGKWNLYQRIQFNPTPGKWPTIKRLIEHTYGKNAAEEDQTEELYDYHTVLIKYPKQMQQGRILYSHQQGTSKSAVAKLEQGMFGSNVQKVNDSEISGDFNAIWIRSLIIWLDEPQFANPHKMSRKFRDMITSTTQNLRKMKQEHIPVPFFGKMLFTTNDSDFMPIESGDRRYWIREVPPFDKSKEDTDFETKMLTEIPHYLHFLLHEREMKYPKKADKTFWLPYNAITSSNAFKKMVNDTKSDIEVACREIIENWFIRHEDQKRVFFTLKTMRTLIQHELELPRLKEVPMNETIKCLRDVLGLEQPEENTSLKKQDPVISQSEGRVGKFWCAHRSKFTVNLNIFDHVGA
jgi:hypothetical protein